VVPNVSHSVSFRIFFSSYKSPMLKKKKKKNDFCTYIKYILQKEMDRERNDLLG
jgi:hypothetical protein